MFVKLTRTNQNGNEKELIVDTNEIVFITECEDHVNYDKPTNYEETTDEDTGIITKVPSEWEVEKMYLIAFKNGRHPQFIDKANYDKLAEILLK